jgi:hypothetical protein
VIVLIVLCIGVGVLELLRRRKIDEEGTLLWFLILTLIVIAALATDFWTLITPLIGAVSPVSTLILASLVFILLMLIYLTAKLSVVSGRLVEVAQRVALVDRELRDLLAAATDQGSGELPKENAK